MKNIKTVLSAVLFCSLFCVLFSSCPLTENEHDDNTFTLATWNVQNIFNDTDDGNEYDEFRLSSGWNNRAYKNRLSNLAIVFSYFNADTVVLNEIENSNVVEDIIFTLKDYPFYCTAKEPDGAISIAIISRYPIKNSCIHTVLGARPILQADIDASGRAIKVFAVHGKSKRDGDDTSARLRFELGKTLDIVSQPESDELIIAAGDFNEDVKENNLFCDIRFGITQAPIKVSPQYNSQYWYNPFLDPSFSYMTDGTYCYHDVWSNIDNIICKNTGNWIVTGSEIVNKGILSSADGKPNAFNRALLTGVSDHYPVTLSFQFLP